MIRTIPFWRRFLWYFGLNIWVFRFGFPYIAIYFRSPSCNKFCVYETGITVGWIPLRHNVQDEFPHFDLKIEENSEDPDHPWMELPEWRDWRYVRNDRC